MMMTADIGDLETQSGIVERLFCSSLQMCDIVLINYVHVIHEIHYDCVHDATNTGAVCFGLQPGVVVTRKSRLTYGVSVLNRFRRGVDPESKRYVRDGIEWCTDVFDTLVRVGESVAVGDTVIRRYAPAAASQRVSVFTVYSTDKPHPRFVTDRGVKKCGTLRLEMDPTDAGVADQEGPPAVAAGPREVQARMTFGDTEIKVLALDVATGKAVRASIDFLSK